MQLHYFNIRIKNTKSKIFRANLEVEFTICLTLHSVLSFVLFMLYEEQCLFSFKYLMKTAREVIVNLHYF